MDDLGEGKRWELTTGSPQEETLWGWGCLLGVPLFYSLVPSDKTSS